MTHTHPLYDEHEPVPLEALNPDAPTIPLRSAQSAGHRSGATYPPHSPVSPASPQLPGSPDSPGSPGSAPLSSLHPQQASSWPGSAIPPALSALYMPYVLAGPEAFYVHQKAREWKCSPEDAANLLLAAYLAVGSQLVLLVGCWVLYVVLSLIASAH